MNTLQENKVISDSVIKLKNYIEAEKFKGYDPYDALESSIFKNGLLRKSRTAKFIFQQIIKRLPFNPRRFLRIPKGYNPVSLGLCLQGYTYLSIIDENNKTEYLEQIKFLRDELVKLKSNGYSGACWGYDFEWQGKYTSFSTFTPTVVATGIITNALFENYKLLGDSESFNLCSDACNFVLTDLNKSYDEGNFCYSYSPIDGQKVFNATLKGARLLSQVYSVTNDSLLFGEAERTVKYVLKHQNMDGSWYYAEGDSRDWIDNFHTGYVLDCLDEYISNTNSDKFKDSLKLGLDFYRSTFIGESFKPKYYNAKTYPIDCTSAAQTILTLGRFNYLNDALKIAQYMIENLQGASGYFFYRKYKFITNKISYMRWSNAWMFAALTYLLYKLKLQEKKVNDLV